MTDGVVVLPSAVPSGEMSLEQAIGQRRSVREYADSSLTDAELGQLLWAAQGVTHARGLRTAPSAGALYPLEIYLATIAGVYHYLPGDHVLEVQTQGDVRSDLCEVALNQEPVRNAPAVFVITAVYARTEQKYGPRRSPRYVHLEAGHAAQNLLLEAVALRLGAVPIGAFDDKGVQDVLGIAEEHQPVYLIPVGRPREGG
jgi:SagB-type dehydrogenase family enzyme